MLILLSSLIVLQSERFNMKKNKKLVRQVLLYASVLALLMATTIAVIGITFVKKAYYDSFAEELHASAVFLIDAMDHEWNGDWSVASNGTILKANYAVHDNFQEQLDSLHEKSG